MALDASRTRKPHTIGAVCRALQEEFADISISKIRYLEDQKLLAPQRTAGGYRLYSDEDVERLRTILRLQRDEFLPLRVIRQELTDGSSTGTRSQRRRRVSTVEDRSRRGRDALLAESGATPELLDELEEFGLVTVSADRSYGDVEAEIVRLALRLREYGFGPRHLRQVHSVAQRAAGLVEGAVAPSVRSRNTERRAAGLDDLAMLSGLVSDLVERLLVRDVYAALVPDAR
jgi:DNA-binding transcriptional MerR regulator